MRNLPERSKSVPTPPRDAPDEDRESATASAMFDHPLHISHAIADLCRLLESGELRHVWAQIEEKIEKRAGA